VVAHNPASNLRLQSGQAAVASLRASGIPIGIGTDSTGMGSRPELFGEIRLARWLEQLDTMPTSISPAVALRDALRGGAAAAGDRDGLGVLRVGAAADIVLLDYEALTARTSGDLDPAEVVAERAQRTSVTDVVVAGQHLVADRRYLLADHEGLEDALAEEAAGLGGDPARAAAVRTLRPHLNAELERLHEVGRGARFVGRPTA
jgi:cytosine/adenosine deaminase-related metal-dependent hydrolase